MKVKIEKEKVSTLGIMCGSQEETVNHILRGCAKCAQVEYRKRHDTVGREVHWELRRKLGLVCSRRFASGNCSSGFHELKGDLENL